MRVTVYATNFYLPVPLRQYAESKVWLAVERATNDLAWTGVRLTREGGADRVSCRMDLWLKRTGIITVTNADRSAEAAVDRAVVRLEQALRHKLANATNPQYWPHGAGHPVRGPRVVVPSQVVPEDARR